MISDTETKIPDCLLVGCLTSQQTETQSDGFAHTLVQHSYGSCSLISSHHPVTESHPLTVCWALGQPVPALIPYTGHLAGLSEMDFLKQSYRSCSLTLSPLPVTVSHPLRVCWALGQPVPALIPYTGHLAGLSEMDFLRQSYRSCSLTLSPLPVTVSHPLRVCWALGQPVPALIPYTGHLAG